MTGPRIAIVDGFHIANYFVSQLREGGARCVHVLSSPNIPPFFTRSFRPENYDRDLGYQPDLDTIVEELSRWPADLVIAATESGVILADQLSERLKTPGNLFELSQARRDKGLMAEAVAAAGLAVPRGRVFERAADGLAWYAAEQLTEVVAKPLDSAGTDNVWFCKDEASLRIACEKILASSTVYGDANDRLMLQERIIGTEYYLNTVSHDGQHRAAEIWRYVKRPGPTGATIYDFEEIVAADSAEAAMLREFTFAVLDALGVVSGAAHTEVIVDSRGPVLIESGARLGGATSPEIISRYSGVAQAPLYAATLLNPQTLLDFDDTKIRWSRKVRLVSLINRYEGTVRSLEWLSRVKALPTVVGVFPSITPGQQLTVTKYLAESPGYLYLAADDQADLERDYDTIRRFEEENVYLS